MAQQWTQRLGTGARSGSWSIRVSLTEDEVRRVRRWLRVTGALGILIVADPPSSAGWAIGLLVGINLLFWGVRTLITAGHIEGMPE